MRQGLILQVPRCYPSREFRRNGGCRMLSVLFQRGPAQAGMIGKWGQPGYLGMSETSEGS